MKLSVSLPDEDVEFLDEYARAVGASSRSAVVQRAVRLLRSTQLGAAYTQAWEEWDRSDDSEIWESTCADGMTGARGVADDAPR
jgi:Arc/MetJ-type ribon-helix-helix transcriptional regulator